jgi:hypothetical protein
MIREMKSVPGLEKSVLSDFVLMTLLTETYISRPGTWAATSSYYPSIEAQQGQGKSTGNRRGIREVRSQDRQSGKWTATAVKNILARL